MQRWRKMTWVSLVIAGLLGGCGGCGGSGAQPGSTARGEIKASGRPIEIAVSETNHDNAPAITRELVEEWPKRWCEIRIGMTREQAVAAMGAYPTDQDSGKVPLIPPIEVESPPEPAGSDTWEAPGSYQFNAFFNLDLRVQQLDFNGPNDALPCRAIRVS